MRKPGFGLGLNRNHYFIFGFLLGLVLSFYIPENVWDLVQSECPQLALENNLIEKFGEDFEPHLNLINKPLAAKKPVSLSIRYKIWPWSLLSVKLKIVCASHLRTHFLSHAWNFNLYIAVLCWGMYLRSRLVPIIIDIVFYD